MKLFDRFIKKKSASSAPGQCSVEADTFGLLLFNRVLGAEDVAEAARKIYGPGAVRSVDDSLSLAPALTLALEGVEFICSCMPMPQPAEVCDFSQIQGGLFSEQEREEILNHKSFLVLSQQGGGRSLEKKRQVCRLFTRLAGALMEREDAVGVFINAAGLMISRRVYLKYAAILEENLNEPEYFPSPLWVGIVQAYSNEMPVTATMGLRQFGFCELAFLEPKSDWAEIHQKLYMMSIFQITGRELYRNMDTIEFTKGNLSVFKEQQGILYIIGGDV